VGNQGNLTDGTGEPSNTGNNASEAKTNAAGVGNPDMPVPTGSANAATGEKPDAKAKHAKKSKAGATPKHGEDKQDAAK
jgi:hypothetical protein